MKFNLIITSIIFIFFSIIWDYSFYSALGISLMFFFVIKFFYEIGKKINIKDIIIIIAILQWIVGPILSYKIFPDDKFYYMAVDCRTYMNYVVPATIAFIFGLYFPLKKKIEDDNFYIFNIKRNISEIKNIDLIFIVIGSISELLKHYVPISLRFLFVLIGEIRFIGLYFLFLTNRKNKVLLTFLIIFWLFVTALKESLFHDLILWLMFFALIVAFITKPSTKRKLFLAISGLFLIVTIQTVKHSFRQLTSDAENKVELFANLVKDEALNKNYLLSKENLSAMVVRINQGWIIARIMAWTPRYEPFAKGETIKRAINAALIPRFLSPNKVTAGGRTYFTRFTGKEISENTSMGLGLIGEAYANYGVDGGTLFLFLIGLFYNFYLVQIYKLARKHPTLIFFIPLIFLQVVKAEIDFSVIINHLVKSTIVVWGIYFVMIKIFKLKV